MYQKSLATVGYLYMCLSTGVLFKAKACTPFAAIVQSDRIKKGLSERGGAGGKEGGRIKVVRQKQECCFLYVCQ